MSGQRKGQQLLLRLAADELPDALSTDAGAWYFKQTVWTVICADFQRNAVIALVVCTLDIRHALHHGIGEILVYMIMSDNYGTGFDH